MPYSIKKISESVASLVITSFPTTFALAITKLTPKTYAWGAATSDATVSTDDGTVTDNGDATFDITDAGTYNISFATDGVYKLTITITGAGVGTYIHYGIINTTVKSLLETQISNNIYCHPDVAYDCSDKLNAVYNTNILSILSRCCFADDINIAFNYADQVTGMLYEGYLYECTNAGTGVRDFAEGATLLLMDEEYDLVPASTELVLNKYYLCVETGTPDTWGSTVLKSASTVFIARLKLIADSIDRIDEYRESCSVKNTCQC